VSCGVLCLRTSWVLNNSNTLTIFMKQVACEVNMKPQ
jgi:hypothetical protein